MKRAVNIIPLIIFFIIIAVGILSVIKDEKTILIEEDLNNEKIVELPDFTLPDLYDSNQNFSKEDLINNANSAKISLINIFASWCTTCRAEHNYLLMLKANKNINIYGIAWNDISQNTIKYLEESGNPYLKTAIDNKGVLKQILSVKGVPETFIINEKGKILYRYQGNIDDAFVVYITKLTEQ